jgi:hypothetical protein
LKYAKASLPLCGFLRPGGNRGISVPDRYNLFNFRQLEAKTLANFFEKIFYDFAIFFLKNVDSLFIWGVLLNKVEVIAKLQFCNNNR